MLQFKHVILEVGPELTATWHLALREDLPVIDVDALLCMLVSRFDPLASAYKFLDGLPLSLYCDDFLTGHQDMDVDQARLRVATEQISRLAHTLYSIFSQMKLFDQGRFRYEYKCTFGDGLMVLRKCT